MRSPTPSLRSLATALGVLVAVGLVSAPLIGSAQRGDGNPSAERERVRADKAQVASEVDALKATDAEVSQALTDLQANVDGQKALYAEAQRAAVQAEQALQEANAAVAAKTAEIELLRDDIRAFAVEAFVRPPSDDALAALDSDDPGEAAEKRALLELQNTSDADLLDRLSAAEEDLEVERALAEEASDRAIAKKAAEENRLGELTSALDQQSAYAEQVQGRLDRALAEAANLEALDANLSKQIRDQQAALARQAAAAATAAARSNSGSSGGSSAPSAPGGGPSGSLNPSLGSASCPSGGSITMASSVVGALQSLMNEAASAGINLCGGGYRDSAAQIATRRNNCGASYYAIYQMPSSQCRPPTAPPGSSMHERGLAVDFTCNGGGVISSRSSSCFRWLASNAASYGFYNLPSEPWHWSTNGN